MATILFTWELGGDMGHIMQIKPLIEGLIAQGHRVFVALRDLSSAHVAFAGLNALLLQAQFRHGIKSSPFATPCTCAQVIADISFGDDATLGNFASALDDPLGVLAIEVFAGLWGRVPASVADGEGAASPVW